MRKFLFLGLATQLSNPKTAVPTRAFSQPCCRADPPSWVAGVILPTIFLIEAGWYGIVAIVFSSERPRRGYLGAKHWLDRLAAGVLGLLGA